MHGAGKVRTRGQGGVPPPEFGQSLRCEAQLADLLPLLTNARPLPMQEQKHAGRNPQHQREKRQGRTEHIGSPREAADALLNQKLF